MPDILENLAATACGQRALTADPDIERVLDRLRREGDTGEPAAPGSKKGRYQDILFEAYINSLLSNPTTHGVNIISNTIPLATRVFETAVSATSVKVFKTAGERASYKDAIAEAGGMAEGIVEAFKFLSVRLKSESGGSALRKMGLPDELAAQSKIERSQQAWTEDNATSMIGKAVFRATGNIVNSPGKALSNMDTFFKIIHYRAEVAKQSMRQALDGGDSSGPALANRFNQIKSKALDGQNPEMLERGLADADFRTYTNQPQGQINKLMAGKGHEVGGLRWVVPFRRTMVNILNYSAESSFVAPALSSKTRKALMKGGIDRDEAVARMAVGSGAMFALYHILGDRLDGEAPSNAQARDLWAKDGHKADSIRFGSGNFPVDMLGPFAPMLKAMSRYQQQVSKIDLEADDNGEYLIDEMAETLLFAVADVAISDHWIENLADLVSAIDDSRKGPGGGSLRPMVQYAARLGTGFIPNVIKKQVTQNIDPGVKDITNPLNAFIAKIPFWSMSITNKVDLYGDDMTYDHFLDPAIRSKITGKDPVSIEMRKIGLRLPEARRTVSKGEVKVKMTPQEYHQYMVYAGKGSMGLPPLRDAIISRMDSRLYKSFATGIGKADLIRNTILDYREAARAAMEQDPNFSFGQRVQEAERKFQYNRRRN